jgi:hypothetical protein
MFGSTHRRWLIALVSSTIIQDIKAMCEAGEASMAYFYFDFRNASKQGLHDLVSSLLTQLSARSSLRCDILSRLYSAHDNGKEQPSDSYLIKCLKDMLTLPDQRPIYLIMDALDESPNTSGIPSAREAVLQFLKELVDLRLPNLHICVTSRPESDIRDVIVPLTSLRVSLHDQTGQKEDIADYVRSVIYSNSEAIIRRWKTEDKDHVIEVLSERADGMYVDPLMVVIVVEIVKQVPMGILSAGNFEAMSSIERQTFSGGIAGIFGRDIRADAEGNQEAKSGSCSTCIAVPCCRHPASSRRGACGGPCGRLRGSGRDSEVETKLAMGKSRTSTFYVVFEFNRRRRHGSFPGCAVRALLGQGILDLGAPRYFKSRCVTLSHRF